MKLFFKITVLIWISNLWGRDIVIITYHQQKENALLVEKIMHERMNIPLLLIQKRWQKKPCTPLWEAILQICLQDNGNILFPILKKDVLLRSFKVFKQRQK